MQGNWRTMSLLSKDTSIKSHRLRPGTWRRVLGFAVPFRSLLIVFIITMLIDAALAVVPALLFQRIIDQGVLVGDLDVVIRLSVAVAVLAVGQAIVSLIQRWSSARIGEGLIYNLRTVVFDHVSSQPISFFARAHTGKLISRLQTDVVGAQQAFTSTLSGLVSNIATLALVLAAMFTLSWQMTLLALILLPIFIFPAQHVGRRSASLTRDRMTHNADLSAFMTERFSVSGALLVKLFGRPQDESASYAAQAARVRDDGVRIAMVTRVFYTAMTLVAALAVAMAYGLGGWMTIREQLTLGSLTAFVALLARLYGPLTQLSSVRVDVMTAMVSFERVFEILDLEPAVRDGENARNATGEPSVSFADVWFTYPQAGSTSLASLDPATAPGEEEPNQPVLQGISFKAEPGQTIALVGPSGSGKTTITNLIARLHDVSAGTVRVGGEDVRELTLASLREQVGYVTQDAHLFHDTIGNNLRYAKPEATDEELMTALDQAQISDLVRRLPDGLNTVVGERGYRVSGGERQRFAIARLLLKSPPIVVLDEATAHLDSASEASVQQALRQAREGRTSIVIAHRLSTVREADQILVVVDGQIVERGTHDSLMMSRGRYFELYTTQLAE